MRKLISSGSTFEAEMGYSRAVVEAGWIFVSGTTGFNYATMQIEPGIEAQTEQCFANIIAVLAEAGASSEDIVRVRYIVPGGPGDFQRCWPRLQKHLGGIRPAATMIVAGLADPRMKIEIEVTARQPA